MTLLSDLIEIPEQVHKSDFVISLATAIGDPAETVRDYVVTGQLVQCFDRALSLVASGVGDNRSKSTYLHASFGAGKTAMMAVLHLLLQGDPAARSIPELAPVVARYANRIDGKRFLLVPYHFVGKSSMEQEVLGGYVEHIRALHPEALLPPVYVADGILDDARSKRQDLGDEVFFRVLSEGEAADEWGEYGAGWDAARFEAALAAPPGSSERDQLVGALLRTHYRALPGQARATAEGFVPFDAGLDAISRHAKGLGYDAVILFLDELVLWLAARMSDVAFVSREGAKVVKLVEADAAARPAPIVSFIARQRDLRELVGEHVLSEDDAGKVAPSHPYVTDARLVKSLLVAALVPEVGPLRALTVSRLTALNSGIVRAFIPGTERQQVLDKLRRWRAEVGELHLGDDEQDPSVWVVLSGIDTGPILDAARVVDSDGERRRWVRELLEELLQVKDPKSFDPWVEVTWRGTRRKLAAVFANVRDPAELPDEMLRAGEEPKLIVDYPWDVEDYGPSDDRGRMTDYRRERPREWTAVWLPNFLTNAAKQLLGKLVRLDYVLTGDTFDRLASHLSPTDRPAARMQLVNEQAAVRERIIAALRQAYGVDPVQPGLVEERLTLSDQFLALDPGLPLQPPVGTSLRTCLEGLADQLLRYRYPKHPEFTELVSRADLSNTLDQVVLAFQQPNGRLENVEARMRRILTKVAGPLRLGTMYQAHFVADLEGWKDLVERRRAEAAATTMTVGQVRRWLDGADTPSDRRGLTREIADLVILLVAAATDRALLDGGRPVGKPEIGRVHDDWELRAQELPSPEMWQEALRRAADMGVMATSTFLSANTVADLGERIHSGDVADRAQAVRDLVPRIREAWARLGLGDEGDRLRTAEAASKLVGELHRRPDHASEVLAACEVPTTAAAIGTSIAQARVVADELQRMNWDLIRHIDELDPPWKADADAVRERLAESLAADELAVHLVGRLRDAATAATDLLARAATRPAIPQRPTRMPPSPAGFDRPAAEEQLREIRRRLRAEAHLDLTWQITEWHGDAEG